MGKAATWCEFEGRGGKEKSIQLALNAFASFGEERTEMEPLTVKGFAIWGFLTQTLKS